MFSFLVNVHVANVNSRSLCVIIRPSVVCLSNFRMRAPLRRLKFSAMFLRPWYLNHPLTTSQNFTEIVRGEPSVEEGVKCQKGSQI